MVTSTSGVAVVDLWGDLNLGAPDLWGVDDLGQKCRSDLWGSDFLPRIR